MKEDSKHLDETIGTGVAGPTSKMN